MSKIAELEARRQVITARNITPEAGPGFRNRRSAEETA